jgi:hypothetical protein
MTSISQNFSEKSQTNEKSNFLRNVLRADSVISTISGIIAIIDAGLLVEFLGMGNSFIYSGIGLALIAYAAAMLYYSRNPEVPRWFAWFTIEADLFWVLVSLVIVFTGVFGVSDAGKWALFLVSDFVLVMAALKYVGLRRLN